ncbi:hypothetical protein ACLMJK_003990 [Lecanora helva]
MPDAWDDDWIAKSEAPTKAAEPAASTPKLTKAERRARQAEFNRQIWADAEDPQDNFFLRTHDVVPLKSDFKPAMKVLSRKPKPTPAAGSDPSAAMGQLNIEDDDSDDDAKKDTMTAQERQEKAAREREEKQKKYEEVRQKLFGDENAPTSRSSSSAKKDNHSRNQSRNKTPRDSRPSSSASNTNRQLYDPNDTGKQGNSSVLKKEIKPTPDEIQPIRTPRNPDNSGRGGFGFAPRGGRVT